LCPPQPTSTVPIGRVDRFSINLCPPISTLARSFPRSASSCMASTGINSINRHQQAFCIWNTADILIIRRHQTLGLGLWADFAFLRKSRSSTKMNGRSRWQDGRGLHDLRSSSQSSFTLYAFSNISSLPRCILVVISDLPI
jgi:hypothetical protein